MSAKDTRKVIGYWLPAVIILFLISSFLIVFQGCTGKDESEEQKPAARETRQRVPQQDKEDTSDQSQEKETAVIQSTVEDTVIDKGIKCRSHSYYIALGSSVALNFEVFLKDDKMRAIQTGSMKIIENPWEDIEIFANLGNANIQVFPITYPIWGINGSDYYTKKSEDGQPPTIQVLDNVALQWREDGFAAIIKLHGYGNARDIGAYTESFLTSKLGNTRFIDYADPASGLSYSWEIEQSSKEEEIHLLVFEITLNTPEEIVGTVGIKTLKLKCGNFGWELDLSYSPSDKRVIISGPGEHPACFEVNQ